MKRYEYINKDADKLDLTIINIDRDNADTLKSIMLNNNKQNKYITLYFNDLYNDLCSDELPAVIYKHALLVFNSLKLYNNNYAIYNAQKLFNYIVTNERLIIAELEKLELLKNISTINNLNNNDFLDDIFDCKN